MEVLVALPIMQFQYQQLGKQKAELAKETFSGIFFLKPWLY